MFFDSVHHHMSSGFETHFKENCSWSGRRLDAGRTWFLGLLGFVGLSMVMIVLYSSGEVGLALKSYLLAPRSEPATSVENFVLRHSGLERGGMSKDILPFPLSAFPTAAGISLSLEAGRAQLGQAEEPEATHDEYIQEAGLEAWTSLAT